MNGELMADMGTVGGELADAVRRKLTCLKSGDLMHVFTMNSMANRDR